MGIEDDIMDRLMPDGIKYIIISKKIEFLVTKYYGASFRYDYEISFPEGAKRIVKYDLIEDAWIKVSDESNTTRVIYFYNTTSYDLIKDALYEILYIEKLVELICELEKI